jgi:hypothetical protein
MDSMDTWIEVVRDLKDSDVDAFETERICRDILRYVRTKRIRDLGKFKQRLGPEYETFLASLSLYTPERVQRIVSDDDFWSETLQRKS